MGVRFGPAGLGPVKGALDVLENYQRAGLRACEIAFTYQAYIKSEKDAREIGEKAKETGISLSVHAPYFVNLNSDEKEKREATKKRILECCRVGNLMGAHLVVFHPGYYGSDREKAYDVIKEGILEIKREIKKNGWKIEIAPETMGKINVFGSIEEIARLVKDTGCSFCLDFAHILARDKKVDFEKIERLFPQKKWHTHFSGIIYGDKGERSHRKTKIEEWRELLKSLPKDKDIVIINEAPTPPADSIEGLEVYEKM